MKTAPAARTKRQAGRKANVAEKGHSETRAKLLEAAFALFAQNGFSIVTIKDIGKQADLNPAMIYYHFESKENLFHECLSDSVYKIILRYKELRSENHGPTELLEAWFELHKDRYVTISRMLKIMMDYSISGTRMPSVDATIKSFYRFEHEIVLDAISRGVADGIFATSDPVRVAEEVSLLLDGTLTRSLIEPKRDFARDIEIVEWMLWNQLGYDGRAGNRAKPTAAKS